MPIQTKLLYTQKQIPPEFNYFNYKSVRKLLTVYPKGHSIRISTVIASQRSDRGGATILISSNQHHSHPCSFQGLTAQGLIMHLLLASAAGAVLIRYFAWSEHGGERTPTLLF